MTFEIHLDAAGPVIASVGAASVRSSLPAGVSTVDVWLDDAALWWPHGLGEQPLYEAVVRLADGSDEWRERIGFRSVRLDTTPDAEGTPFVLVVNDVPVPVRGANWIPDDCFPSRVTPARVRARIDQAVDANVNLLRIWGGGVYESREFYRACDERGVLVWQVSGTTPTNWTTAGTGRGSWPSSAGRPRRRGRRSPGPSTTTPLTPTSPGVLHHQKAEDGNGKLSRGLAPHLPVPDDIEDWVWAMQLNQARAITVGVTHFRSLRPRCSGTIVWQLNDCWPVTYWAAVDGDGRRKPLWYALRAAYTPRLLTFQPHGSGPRLTAVNDTLEPWTESLAVRRLFFDGDEWATFPVELDVPPLGTVHIALPTDVATPGSPARPPRPSGVEVTSTPINPRRIGVEVTSTPIRPSVRRRRPATSAGCRPPGAWSPR